MPVNYFVEVRRLQKQTLLDFINAHNDLSIKKIVALFSMKTGLRISTIETYVQELKDADLIITDKEGV